ncbi:tRNA (guanosine(46)-N7)-methyltransferase TrmB [Buchnera aphidicola]|uniref:tRNA (guanosine(46)-N7)-methyltransferase TrmB n=1 Tax=Buchnera aphidicola TaxID=9 RepID=UPI003463EFC1
MNISLKKKSFDIKTFKLRSRKLSLKKKKIIDSLWPLIGINITDKHFKIQKIFNKNIPVILDIGFGFGESLVNYAKLYKNIYILGIEIYIPGICYCLKEIYKNNLNNVRIIYLDFIYFLKNYLKNFFFHIINIFFPDPWPKRKHYKRRMIQKNIINCLLKQLSIKGIIHIVTDCFSYAINIIKVLNLTCGLKCLSKDFRSYYVKKNNCYTRYKKYACIKKNKIYEIIYQKIF